MKNKTELLEDTEDINEFTMNFVLESAENVGSKKDKIIKKISNETCQLMEKR